MKIKLRLKKRHPRKSFRLGRHVVETGFKEFDLNESEEKELKSKGCQAWIMKEGDKPTKKKTPAKKNKEKES